MTNLGRDGRFVFVALSGAYDVTLSVNGETVWGDHIVIRAGRATLDLDVRSR